MVETLVPLAAAVALVVVVPGPNVVAVVMSSMRDRRAGLWTAVGVSTGDLLWAVAALVGLGALLQHARPVFMGVRWAGAAYLVVLAVSLWRRAGRDGSTDGKPTVQRRPFVNGLLVDLANPKAAVFFTSLYASLLPPDLKLWSAGIVLTTTMGIIYGWYALLALLLSRPSVQRAYGRSKRVVSRVSAGAMGALGVRLALTD